MPHPVDVYVGKRIRHRRWLLGKSQKELGSNVGLTLQQIQQYESVANRISASRLWAISLVLEVEPPHFFEGLKARIHGSDDQLFPAQLLQAKEAVDIVRIFYRIPEHQRAQLSSLAKALAAK